VRAVVAKRYEHEADLSEIVGLAEAAGYEVAATRTQKRTEDAAYHFGEGKVSELAGLCVREDADALVVDNEVGPYQKFNIGKTVPEGVQVVDRFTLILEIFGQRAQTRKAQLQVELAELRYELPRAEAKTSLAKRDERPGFMGLGEYDESREQDIKSQISRIRDELDQIADTEGARRERRRESGFDLVALAGYTNAGKSTLLRRLADALDVDENADRHPDLDDTAVSENQLFTTLGTTTRRADTGKREVLVTDTVGFISDLPHWLVDSFHSTLSSVYHADLVLLVVDASEPVERMREKLTTSHDTLRERNEAPIVTVFNKTDRVDDAALRRKRDALSSGAEPRHRLRAGGDERRPTPRPDRGRTPGLGDRAAGASGVGRRDESGVVGPRQRPRHPGDVRRRPRRVGVRGTTTCGGPGAVSCRRTRRR